jgi:hypothetical protein
MDANDLNINLADPEDIKAKLPEVERVVAAKHKDWQTWESLASNLARAAGVKRKTASGSPIRKVLRFADQPKRASKPKAPSTQTLAVKVIEEAHAAMDVGQVAEKLLEVMDSPVKKDTVGWALWKAEEEGQLQRVKKGVYAPLDYKPSQDETESGRASGLPQRKG